MRFFAINKSGEVIPMHGIVRLSSDSTKTKVGQSQHDAHKPASADAETAIYAINTSGDVPVNGEFVATSFNEATHVLINPSSPPSFGAACGPGDGWEADPEGSGLVCVSAVSNQNVRILSLGSNGTQVSDGSGGSGSCGCCETVEVPDTILTDGIKTTSQRVLCEQLNPIKYRYEWGTVTITFPEPEEMILKRVEPEPPEPPSDTFLWDIPEDAFSAVYRDGTDATPDLVEPSGSVIFNHTVEQALYDCGCPQMRMRIEWDVVEPIPPDPDPPPSGGTP